MGLSSLSDVSLTRPSFRFPSFRRSDSVFRLLSADNDGCIAIWALEDSDKPLSVRTVELEDVNITDAESVSRSSFNASTFPSLR